jgi:hypothetical protein
MAIKTLKRVKILNAFYAGYIHTTDMYTMVTNNFRTSGIHLVAAYARREPDL